MESSVNPGRFISLLFLVIELRDIFLGDLNDPGHIGVVDVESGVLSIAGDKLLNRIGLDSICVLLNFETKNSNDKITPPAARISWPENLLESIMPP